jgi:tRNA modification GTPase
MQDDTIAAISTPLGEGGIGIVRMSGRQAVPIAEKIFRSTSQVPLSQVKSHTLHHGFIVSQGKTIDEVLVSVMHAPRTYTREDVVEINCHGGIVATRTVLDAALEAGARLAERGEFTRRAFLNGRISLDQAKAVLDIVKAKTKLGLGAAVDRLNGRFTADIAVLRRELGQLLAGVEVGINFPDVETEPQTILPALTRLLDRTEQLLAQGERGRILREGLTLAIIGRPNVGKSTLFNTLLQEERAIVTPLPGTTRDTVEEEIALDGIPVRVIDTAGLRESDEVVESAGIRRAERAIERADLLFLMLDRSVPLTEEDSALLQRNWAKPVFLILNKSDLPRNLSLCHEGAVYEISAKTGEGVDRVLREVVERVLGGKLLSREGVLLLDTWERDLLRRAAASIRQGVEAVRTPLSWDMIAEELRAAYTVTGELQGIDVSEEILREIFSRFCVGK